MDRIELLVSEARKSAPVTHFIAIPCASPEVVQSFEIFKEAVINNAGIPEESRNPELFISATKLHITVCVLWIFDDEEQKKATEVIEQCRGDILALLPDGSFGVELSGVETWEDDPKNVKVIFASIKSEPLQRICDLLRKRLVLAGLSPKTEKKLSTVDSSVRMHMTLMKSGYVDRPIPSNGSNFPQRSVDGDASKPKAFDASVILEEYKDFHFGTFTVNKIALCSMHTIDPETGFYRQAFEMTLP